jgi:hypothetical protein
MRRLLTLVALLLAVSTATVSCGSSGARGRAELTFTRFAGQPESVWVAAADGSHAREITANGRASTLSPDGRWLTFERDETQPGSEFMRLFLVDLTTGSRVPSPCGKPRSERASYLRSWHHFAAKVPLYP